MNFQDRIVGLQRERGSDLMANPRNWRRHTDAQRAALQAILEEIGFAGAALAYSTGDGLVLIDGHLRAEEAGDSEIPVLVTDLTQEEADKMLAVFDPIGAMAQADPQQLKDLVDSLQTDSEALETMLKDLLSTHAPDFLPSPEETQGRLDQTMTRTVTCPSCGKLIEL